MQCYGDCSDTRSMTLWGSVCDLPGAAGPALRNPSELMRPLGQADRLVHEEAHPILPQLVEPIFTARCTLVQSAVLPSHVVCLSVCPVRLSVTLVDCDHTGLNSSKIISPLVSLGRSLFATPT